MENSQGEYTLSISTSLYDVERGGQKNLTLLLTTENKRKVNQNHSVEMLYPFDRGFSVPTEMSADRYVSMAKINLVRVSWSLLLFWSSSGRRECCGSMTDVKFAIHTPP